MTNQIETMTDRIVNARSPLAQVEIEFQSLLSIASTHADLHIPQVAAKLIETLVAIYSKLKDIALNALHVELLGIIARQAA